MSDLINKKIDELEELLYKNGHSYIILTQLKGQPDKTNLRSDLMDWCKASDRTLREDIKQLLDVSVFSDGEGDL